MTAGQFISARHHLDSSLHTLLLGQVSSLNDIFSADSKSDTAVQSTMEGFLASVERRAYVIALSSCRDQQIALDIVQDSMFKMVKSYSNKPSEQWPPLFFKVLNNRISDQHRKRGFDRLVRWFGVDTSEDEQVTDAIDQLASDEIGPDSLSDSIELKQAMETALSSLSFKQQQALILRLWQGLSVKETAIAMEISEGSVKTHLSRAVHEMREHLQEYR